MVDDAGEPLEPHDGGLIKLVPVLQLLRFALLCALGSTPTC